jgi:FMN phosphatase YigB (HAD superfamily)
VTSFAAAIEAGSRLVGLPPGDCLFVDDDPDLVAAAVGLGYRGFALDRTTATLDDVLPIVAASP